MSNQGIHATLYTKMLDGRTMVIPLRHVEINFDVSGQGPGNFTINVKGSTPGSLAYWKNEAGLAPDSNPSSPEPLGSSDNTALYATGVTFVLREPEPVKAFGSDKASHKMATLREALTEAESYYCTMPGAILQDTQNPKKFAYVWYDEDQYDKTGCKWRYFPDSTNFRDYPAIPVEDEKLEKTVAFSKYPYWEPTRNLIWD